jgi:hypothetical protein
MEILAWKVKLALLWVFAAGGWLVSFSINLMMPGVIQGIVVGQIGNTPINEGRMVFYALLYVIPFAMALLCLTLRDSWNQWLNMVAGVVFGIIVKFYNLVQEYTKIYSQIAPEHWTNELTDEIITWCNKKQPKGEPSLFTTYTVGQKNET